MSFLAKVFRKLSYYRHTYIIHQKYDAASRVGKHIKSCKHDNVRKVCIYFAQQNKTLRIEHCKSEFNRTSCYHCKRIYFPSDKNKQISRILNPTDPRVNPSCGHLWFQANRLCNINLSCPYFHPNLAVSRTDKVGGLASVFPVIQSIGYT